MNDIRIIRLQSSGEYDVESRSKFLGVAVSAWSRYGTAKSLEDARKMLVRADKRLNGRREVVA